MRCPVEVSSSDRIMNTSRKRRRYPRMSTAKIKICCNVIAVLLLLLLLCSSINILVHALIVPYQTSMYNNRLSHHRHQQSKKIWGIQQNTNSYTSYVHSSTIQTYMTAISTAISKAPSTDSQTTTKPRIKGQSATQPNTKKKQTKKSNKKRKQQKSKSKSKVVQEVEPWNANYNTSLRTQRRIQSAAYKGSNSQGEERAQAILQTLLSSSPTECNAANIVCALTLSSKALPRRRNINSPFPSPSSSTTKVEEALQTSLQQTLSILQTLIKQNKLTPRQLCNASWSIAKYVEYEPSLYLSSLNHSQQQRHSPHKGATMLKDVKKWNLNQSTITTKNEIQQQGMESLIEEILNLIALRIVEHLEDTRFDNSLPTPSKSTSSKTGKSNKQQQQLKKKKHRVQPGELSMLLWSFATIKRRDCPPGWEVPRRLERLSTNNEKNVASSEEGEESGGEEREARREDSGYEKENVDYVTFTNDGHEEENVDYVTFVEFDDSSKSASANRQQSQKKKKEYTSITSKLFDAAAIAFCQGEGSAVKQLSSSTGTADENPTTLLKACKWSELSNIAWSYATRGAYRTKEGEAMLSFFAKEATRRIEYCNTSSSQSSSSSGGDKDCNNILPRDVIQIAWALGTMESDNVSVGDSLVHLVDAINNYWIMNGSFRPLQKWTCADLVQMATALAHGRLDNQDVLMAVYEESLERIRISRQDPTKKHGGFSTSEISILLWVQARLYLTSKFGSVYETFPNTASRALLERMDRNSDYIEQGELLPPMRMQQYGLGSQEQANLAWSLTVLETYDDNVVILLQNIFHAASANDEGIIQLEHAHQLWQSYFLLSKDCPEAVKYVPQEFSQYLEEKWNIEKGRRKTSSSRHRAISQTLTLMKVAHRNEYDEDVDVAIVLDEDSMWTHTAKEDFSSCFDGFDDNVMNSKQWKKVAMEFDGPHHFTVMASSGKDLEAMANGEKIKPRVLGHTVLKYRLLKKKGWTVVRIPYYEFDKIPFWASMERQRYLQRALKTHEKIEFSDIDISEYKAMPSTRHSRFD